MKKILILSFIALILSSCIRQIEDRGIKVITTTSFVTDTVSRIAGDKVEITGLIKPGQDPHSYDPSPRDIAKVEQADIIFVNGFDLEEGLLPIFKNVNGSKIVPLSETVDYIEAESEEGHHDEGDHHNHEIDPHTWMSPINVIKWAEIAAEHLAAIDEPNRDYYEKNRETYSEELIGLHREIIEKLSVIDMENRVMITDHDSLAYFAREYDFTVSGTIIPGTSSNSDTSPRALSDLIKVIEESEITTIFIGETSGPDVTKLAENIRSELNKPVKIVVLKSGSLDTAGSDTADYIGYMKYNTEKILDGLAGE